MATRFHENRQGFSDVYLVVDDKDVECWHAQVDDGIVPVVNIGKMGSFWRFSAADKGDGIQDYPLGGIHPDSFPGWKYRRTQLKILQCV
jgi:hypothetical protein